MLYYNFIKILKKSTRQNCGDHYPLINLIKSESSSIEYESIDGGVLTDTVEFDPMIEEIVFASRGGPATRIARRISKITPDAKIRIRWQSENFKSGKLFYKSGLQIGDNSGVI